MNNDLIERIARAIFNDDPQWDRFPPEYRAKYIQQARAALTVMQREAGEPTKAMIDLAERAIGEWFATHDGEEIDCRALARIAVMQGEVGGLREALEPFAEMARHLDNTAKRRDAIYCGGDPGLKCEVTQADYHRARKALAASPPLDQPTERIPLREQVAIALMGLGIYPKGRLVGYSRDAYLKAGDAALSTLATVDRGLVEKADAATPVDQGRIEPIDERALDFAAQFANINANDLSVRSYAELETIAAKIRRMAAALAALTNKGANP